MPSSKVIKRLSVNEVRTRVAAFAHTYRDAASERQLAGEFWTSFFRCFGIDAPYSHGIEFEYPARRASTGATGYIDVFCPSSGQGRDDGFLIEHKSRGSIKRPKADGLSNAEEQGNDYLRGGDIPPHAQPRWVLVSDFATIQITDRTQPRTSLSRTRTLHLSDLPHHVEDFLWLTGEDTDTLLAEEQTEASIAAARLMGDLYAAMTGDADTPTEPADEDDEPADLHAVSVLLTRLLFLMFGDDADLWRRGLFQRFVETRTAADGSDLGGQLNALFDILNTPEHKRPQHLDEAFAAFPYVNGDLFESRERLAAFNSTMRNALLEACRFDWSRISPAVFGSLFQTVKSKAARHGAGEHYTSEANILKTLGPLFLDDLRRRVNKAKSAPQLQAIHSEMRNLRFVDPACGCGNFLIVAYRELRAIELDLLVKMRERQGKAGDLILDPTELLHVSLDQFSGIELNWWPAKIAQTAMFLIDHQCNQRMQRTLGATPTRLPITISATIHHANALTTDWNPLLPGPGPTVYLFGNPPYQGHEDRSTEQTAELKAAWRTTKVGHLDYVTAWYAKVIDYLADKVGEFAYVTTNSITQGEPVAELFGPLQRNGWRMKFAHRTFKWDSESSSKEKAGVSCVITGHTRDPDSPQRLFAYARPTDPPHELKPSIGINGYLVDGPDVLVTSSRRMLAADLARVDFGSMPNDGKGLLIEPADYPAFMADPVAAKYVRPFVGAKGLINNHPRWCLWLTELDPDDVKNSSLLAERVTKVREHRLRSKRHATQALAATPHLFGERRQPEVAYLGIPRHWSQDRPFATVARFEPNVIAGDAIYTCDDPDGFAFAIISSSMFITWQKTVGGRIRSDPRFSANVVWNNLPLPHVSDGLRADVIDAGKAVMAARELHPNRTLAQHYERLAMTQELVDAHRALDKVVDKAFGARTRKALDELGRQTVLFKRYVELTKQSG